MAYIPHFTAEGLSEQITSDNVNWTDLATLTVVAGDQVANSDYLLFWSGEFQSTLTTTRVKYRVTQDDTEKSAGQAEAKEAVTPIDYTAHGGFLRFQSGASPASVTFKIQIQTSISVNVVKAKNGRLTLLKLPANSAYDESLTRTTTTSTTYQDSVSVTFTPPSSGDYIILCNVVVDGSATAFGCRTRLSDGTSTTTGLGFAPKDATDRWPRILAWSRTGLSGSQTFKLQYASQDSSATAGVTGMRIVALRVSDFDNVYSSFLGTQSSGTDTSYVDALTLTQTTAANDHLQLATWAMEGDINSSTSYTNFLADGATVNDHIREANDITADDSILPAVSHVTGALTAASHTWKIQRKSEASGLTTRVKVDSALLVFDLGAAATAAAALLDQPVRPFLHLLLR